MESGRVPNKLKLFRHSFGYSQKKVARMLGLRDITAISRWEQGISMPTVMQLMRLARLYRTHPHELYDELWQSLEHEFSSLLHTEQLSANELFFYE